MILYGEDLKNSQENVKKLFDHIEWRLTYYYHICVMRDMWGPTGMNILDGKRRTFAAGSFICPLNNLDQIVIDIAHKIAGEPERLPVDPMTYHSPFQQLYTHVALYAYTEINNHKDAVIRAARINVTST